MSPVLPDATSRRRGDVGEAAHEMEARVVAVTPPDPLGQPPPIGDSADAILLKMARSGLADLQTGRAADSPEHERPGDEMARHLLQLKFSAWAEVPRSNDAPSAASPQ